MDPSSPDLAYVVMVYHRDERGSHCVWTGARPARTCVPSGAVCVGMDACVGVDVCVDACVCVCAYPSHYPQTPSHSHPTPHTAHPPTHPTVHDDLGLVQACPNALQPPRVLRMRPPTVTRVLQHHRVVHQSRSTLQAERIWNSNKTYPLKCFYKKTVCLYS